MSLVATPIGNLGDLSPRARETLETAELILAEDTRRTGLLLSRLGLAPARMLSFFEHNEEARQGEVLEALRAGQSVALVSDAGTPLLSDPGYTLVRACREEGLPVRVIPGPSAVLTALAASGLAPVPFTFLGFAPRKKSEGQKLLEQFAHIKTTLVFFERKDRLAETLALAAEVLGPRELCLARELTKTHEEILLSRLDQPVLPEACLGEFTVVIGPPEKGGRSSEQQARSALGYSLAQGLKPREAARRAGAGLSGWSVKELYSLIAGRTKE